jgi:hypothetical protein
MPARAALVVLVRRRIANNAAPGALILIEYAPITVANQ